MRTLAAAALLAAALPLAGCGSTPSYGHLSFDNERPGTLTLSYDGGAAVTLACGRQTRVDPATPAPWHVSVADERGRVIYAGTAKADSEVIAGKDPFGVAVIPAGSNGAGAPPLGC